MNGDIRTLGWFEANQRYLAASVAVVRHALERNRAEASRSAAGPESRAGADDELLSPKSAVQAARDLMTAPPALEVLCELFGLSVFERDVLLLSAAVELNGDFAAICATAQGDPSRNYPTFSLALAALPEAHWSALTPAAPLRYWRLIEAGTGGVITLSPLRIDERILHYLTGVHSPDERLAGLFEPARTTDDLAASHAVLATRIVSTLTRTAGHAVPPVIQLCGADNFGKRALAASACAGLGLRLNVLSAALIPATAGELDALIRLWSREAALTNSALLLDCDALEATDPTRTALIARFIEQVRGFLFVSSRERRSIERMTLTFDISRPTPAEQLALWRTALGSAADSFNGQVERVAAQFTMSAATIRAASSLLIEESISDERDASAVDDLKVAQPVSASLWNTCRVQARARLDQLAQRIEPAAQWDDLILPDSQRQTLRDLAAHLKHRQTVYDSWGFAAKGSRGLGISALFAGSSGTGKTMAAEVLAAELQLDLYCIDLSQVVSKYIGETEKNLRRVFDAAEEGSAILLFDEADALFGKRSEVKDSHDRYANIEVSYLLQRMEAYRGLAILTTNMKQALDTAFLRRIRFVVQFPFPDTAQRTEIWRRIFPSRTPTDGLQMEKLARLNVAGGNIRNIALNAAFLAADAGEPVRMSHLLRAARSEYAKLEKPLTESEIGGWK